MRILFLFTGPTDPEKTAIKILKITIEVGTAKYKNLWKVDPLVVTTGTVIIPGNTVN